MESEIFDIPDYDRSGISSEEIITIRGFVQTVHNAGYAYVLHKHYGSISSAYLNPRIPDYNIIPTTIDTPTTGCYKWWPSGNVDLEQLPKKMTDKLDEYESQFIKNVKDETITGTAVVSFLTKYFWYINCIYGQKFDYYALSSADSGDEQPLSWSGIGLSGTSDDATSSQYYKDLTDYRNATSSIYQSILTADAENLRSIITSDKIKTIIDNLMIFNSNQELWYYHGIRNRKEPIYVYGYYYSWIAGPQAAAAAAKDAASHGWEIIKTNTAPDLSIKYKTETLYMWKIDSVNWKIYIFYSKELAGYNLVPTESPLTGVYKLHSPTYLLTMGCNPDSSYGVLTPSVGMYSYDMQQDVVVKQTPNYGKLFDKWSNNVDYDGNYKVKLKTVGRNVIVTAYYKQQMINVKLTSSDFKLGFCIGSGKYEYGSNITIRARVESDGVFKKWSDGNNSSSRTFSNVTSDINLTAYFEEDYGSLNVQADSSCKRIVGYTTKVLKNAVLCAYDTGSDGWGRATLGSFVLYNSDHTPKYMYIDTVIPKGTQYIVEIDTSGEGGFASITSPYK